MQTFAIQESGALADLAIREDCISSSSGIHFLFSPFLLETYFCESIAPASLPTLWSHEPKA